MTISTEQLKEMIVDVPDFPKEGVVFKDITPILLDPVAYEAMIQQMVEKIDFKVTKVAAIESRGFLLGTGIAQKLNAGLVLIRKKGKLPRKVMSETYALEYGEDKIELQEGDLVPGDSVLIVDDVLATGGTAQAAEKLCRRSGADVNGLLFLMGLSFLEGDKKLEAPSFSLFSY